MKRALFLTALIFATTAFPQDEKKHPLDAKVNAILDKASSTADMVRANDEGARLWDAEMNRCFSELKKKLAPAAFAELQAAQRQWLVYRDAQYRFYREFYGRRDGTMYIPMSSAAALRVVRTRALELHHTLEVLKEFGD